MYTLKSIAQRGTLFGAAAALVVAAVVPAASVFADELNPLTKRSLLLTSSAPGFMDTDGSGNSFASPNSLGENYAPAGSGPNGKKTGETFTFNVSTNSATSSTPVKALTFQYCTAAAGKCQAPGNNAGDSRDADRVLNSATTTTSDLNVNYASPVYNTDFTIETSTAPGVWAPSAATDWTMEAVNLEDQDYDDTDATQKGLTGTNNYITLKSATGISPVFDESIRIVFKATETNHITNPGQGSFFVKINTYKDNTAVSAANIIDGGVTVANVMTDSIHITTKVLETMSFSVGTKNRDTAVVGCAFVDQATTPDCEGVSAVHGTCDPIKQINNNRLQLGDPNAEFSLSTERAYDVYSYWRLSSNSSGGASVYYSGDTLRNTVGDEISEIGNEDTNGDPAAAASTPGTEQFGLAYIDATIDDSAKAGPPAQADKFDPAFRALVASTPERFKLPTLFVLNPVGIYANGAGTITDAGTASFAFVQSSMTVPELIAQDNTQVISCDTAKMRYVANIGADTPAGVYTTKINYLAAPQY